MPNGADMVSKSVEPMLEMVNQFYMRYIFNI